MRFRFSFPKTAGLLVLITAMAISAGCTSNNEGQQSGMQTQNYSNDGYLGTTNANPHIPGPHMSLTYGNDARLMQDAVRGVSGVTGVNVTFNGADAYVTLKIDPSIESRRIPTIERQAAAVLRFNFPRYNIFVQSLSR